MLEVYKRRSLFQLLTCRCNLHGVLILIKQAHYFGYLYAIIREEVKIEKYRLA
jgi:hypothetical protein